MALIAIAADLHLGVSGFGKMNPLTGLNQQVEVFLNDFNKLCDSVIAAKVDSFVILGDIFHTRTPSNVVRESFAASIKRVLDAGVGVLIVLGNHDIQLAMGAQDSLADIRAIAPQGLHIIKDPEIVRFDANHSPVQFLCLPWRKHASEITLAASRLMGQLDPDVPAFTLGHFTVSGAVSGAEVLYQLGGEEAVPAAALVDKRIERVFLGHIHKRQIIDEKLEYIGSMDRVDFSERNEAKKCLILKVKGKGDFKTSYIDLSPQKYVQLEFDLSKGDKIELKSTDDIKDAVVKIQVVCTEAQKKAFDYMAFTKVFRDAFFVMEPSFEVLHEDGERRSSGVEKGMGLEESLSLWLDGQKVDAAMKKKVIEKAKELMAMEATL